MNTETGEEAKVKLAVTHNGEAVGFKDGHRKGQKEVFEEGKKKKRNRTNE